MNKKIFFFIGGMGWGGAERVIGNLADFYVKKDYDVTIVTLLYSDVAYELNKKIKIVNLVGPKKNYFKNVHFWIKGIKRLIKVEKPDIAVSFVCRINLLVILSMLFMKKRPRLVISERNDPRYDGRGKMAVAMSKRLYKKADAIICQTNAEKNFFGKKIQRKIMVIPNPVFLKTQPVVFDKKKKIIINAARYSESKNHRLLIEAYSKLVERSLDNGFNVHLYGTGDLKQSLIEYVEQLHLESRVMIFDSVPNVQEKISEASIFCLTSNYEGLSNALMEACLLGTPCISTNVSGAEDMIVDKVNGYIVPVGDVDSLLGRLIELVSSETTRKQFHDYCLSDEYQSKYKNAILKYDSIIDGYKVGK